MIIDYILDRKDDKEYNAKHFYTGVMQYGTVGHDILRAMDGGNENDVKMALCDYIQNNDYNPLLIDYINSLNWLGKTELSVEIAASKKFDDACAAREAAAEKMNAPEGKESVFAYECGVLVLPEHEEFEYYANNNPALPFGFYDEDQGAFLKGRLLDELYRLKQYVKEGVENTYAIVSFQGVVDVGGSAYDSLKYGDSDVSDVSYSYFKNSDEIVWSACKKDGRLVERFLEKELETLETHKLSLDKKIQDATALKPVEQPSNQHCKDNLEL